MSLKTLVRYWQTVRYLRPVQLYGRLWFRLNKPVPDLRAAPMLRGAVGVWKGCSRPSSMRDAATFQFLGVERTIASAADWNRGDWPKLWLYNAHYFDDLLASSPKARTAWHTSLVTRWITENPPGLGNGWEPYPSSLRIVNWVKWALSGHALDDAATQSLVVQVRFLRKRLEIHLLGNHLWANAKALLFAGAFFDGDEAAAWHAKGLALLRHELEEQILADGGHFERSPMYHAIVLEDILDLVQLAAIYPGLFLEADVGRWRAVAERMLHWLRVMSHPDGAIAFFNDAAFDIAPDTAALDDYARVLDIAVANTALNDIEALVESGYVRLQAGVAVLIVDVAAIGPDYLPGHAHADTLSFELSLDQRRVLVNGGTSTYEATSERLHQRRTAMHNTVLVDGVDSSEVWGSFRVARRARPFDVHWGQTGNTLWVEAAHDGYQRLPGAVIHRRRWELHVAGLRVTDTLTGRFQTAVAHFRLAPDLSPMASGKVIAEAPDERQLQWRSRGQTGTTVMPSTWHPRFGVSESCRVLALSFTGPTLETEFLWS